MSDSLDTCEAEYAQIEEPLPREAKAIILIVGASFVVAALALGVALR